MGLSEVSPILLRRGGTSGDGLVTLCSELRHLEQVAQGPVQFGFEYLQGWTQPL